MTPSQKPLDELFLEKREFDRPDAYADAAGMHISAFDKDFYVQGAETENARRKPIDEAVAEVLRTLDATCERYEEAEAKNGSDLARGCSIGIYHILASSRANLRKVLEQT